MDCRVTFVSNAFLAPQSAMRLPDRGVIDDFPSGFIACIDNICIVQLLYLT